MRIHPYADGNGRMARLLANLPVIEKGELPILIPAERPLEYIEALASWRLANGPLRRGFARWRAMNALWPHFVGWLTSAGAPRRA